MYNYHKNRFIIIWLYIYEYKIKQDITWIQNTDLKQHSSPLVLLKWIISSQIPLQVEFKWGIQRENCLLATSANLSFSSTARNMDQMPNLTKPVGLTWGTFITFTAVYKHFLGIPYAEPPLGHRRLTWVWNASTESQDSEYLKLNSNSMLCHLQIAQEPVPFRKVTEKLSYKSAIVAKQLQFAVVYGMDRNDFLVLLKCLQEITTWIWITVL